MEVEKNQFDTQPIGTLLLKLSLPSIAAQLINLLYNVVDRIFLGRIPGEGAMILAGLGITVPLINLITAFAALIGSGGGPLVAIAAGKRNYKEAEKILGNCVILLLILSVTLTIFFGIWGEKMLIFLGADETTLPYAVKYLKVYVLGTVFVMCSLGLNPFLITQGFHKISMRNTFIGAGLNIILDPILIYGFHMGIMGAAIATVVSQGVSAILIVAFLIGKHTKIRAHYTALTADIVSKVCNLGFASFFMYATESVVQTVVFQQLLKYGNSNHVAALSVMFSINQIIFLPIQGIGQGAQPIISYNFGAGKVKRLKEAIRKMLVSNGMISFLGVCIVELFPKVFLGIFTKDSSVLEVGLVGVRLYFFGRILTGVQLGFQETFRSVGYGKTAIFNATMRKLVYLIPLTYLLPELFSLGSDGVFLAESIADILAVITATIVFLVFRKQIYERARDNQIAVE